MKQENLFIKVGLTVFLTVAAILLFYDTLFGSRAAVIFGSTLMGALMPILYGAFIAYLLAPVVNFFERKLFPSQLERVRTEGKLGARGPRAVSLLLTWILICVFVYLLLSILLPELYRSLLQLIGNAENYYNIINGWVMNALDKNPSAEAWAMQLLQGYYNDLVKFTTEKIMPQAQQLFTALSCGIATALGFLKNLVVGIIVSFYLLATKERCAAHARKMIYGLFSSEKTYWVFRGIHKIDSIFSGFVRGKLLDSLIIGCICFIVCQILNMPYTPLVSVIVGVTNVIPFFGPFLGAVPSLFLILLVSPVQALYFFLFIILLQQVDGNIIGPKILGDKTGLSGLWVITAILVGGSFFGVAGMFFGVPVFACGYSLVNFLIRARLKKKGLPLKTRAYRTDQPEQETSGTERSKEKL